MGRILGFKLGAIALLILLLLVPLTMIDGLVSERQYQRAEVLQDIARSSSYRQQLTGPILVMPYTKVWHLWKTHPKSGERYMEEQRTSGRLYFLPERFVLNGQVATEERARGIYKALLYRSDNQISGAFKLPARLGLGDDLGLYQFERPFLSVGISDIRGISNDLQLRFNGQTLSFAPGSAEERFGAGVHAPLPVLDSQGGQTLEFAFDLKLQGTEQLSITPVGRDSRVELTSTWPHPSFVGEYLPSSREVSDKGFSAHWQTSFFATNLEEALVDCVRRNECDALTSRNFGVSFVDPVDQYLKTDRAIKYALLFIGLTFAVFFLFEVLKRMAVHPVQYALVGMSLALFYLLLLSLSEHLSFALAYGIAASACVLLIGFYVSHVLHSALRGGAFAALLALLYAMLFGLLGAEDYALLMGSVLVFGVLAGVMVLTRKLDWYGVGRLPVTSPVSKA
ncbi:MAG: cell envelope integrity protein CreD [Gammaproteobacteria bacterium]|nr:cell envelope integrity protein CreD [Gammaproteobacteria bacterium]MBU1491625.1 cell envelope integrity protein CreD [Gammaproteobacteria bacterium]MBU2067169.1 cell envelope integrity protein CreD [Gammaproteobacteria bacterium]MBU2217833.1 cell envelope integrity protein CreD [Gammaproteobacteria bacterium]MBU2322975.1 cell envelope integrity protein CreD [Gammaproteobacteria bacterium]